MSSHNANHILIDLSPKFGCFPPSTTSGSLAVLHNSDTILFPSSAIAPPLLLASMPSPPPHQPGPPFPPPPDSSIYLSCLSTLFTLFPFQLVSFSSTPLSVHLFSNPLYPDSQVSTGRGQGLMVIKPNPCVSHKRHQVQRERQLRFPLRLLRKTGSRAQPAVPNSALLTHNSCFSSWKAPHRSGSASTPQIRADSEK